MTRFGLQIKTVFAKLSAVLSLAVLVLGCDSAKTTPSNAIPGSHHDASAQITQANSELRIAMVSSLQTVAPKLFADFEAETGVKVIGTFGATVQLSRQLEAGAEFDLFLSANQESIASLAQAKLIRADSVQSFAVGELVLVRLQSDTVDNGNRADSTLTKLSLEDLGNTKAQTIAIANPKTAPYGAAAVQVLNNLKLWDKLESEQRIIQAETIHQAAQFVLTGNADVGLIARTVLPSDGKKVEWLKIPSALYDPIVHDLGIMSATPRQSVAERFARYLMSDRGQNILAEFGFGPAPHSPPRNQPRSVSPPQKSAGLRP